MSDPQSIARQELRSYDIARSPLKGPWKLTVPRGQKQRDRRLLGDLTAREIDVLNLIAAGEPNGVIAADLGISLNTVERHVNHIFAKLGASNRVQAANYAHTRSLRG